MSFPDGSKEAVLAYHMKKDWKITSGTRATKLLDQNYLFSWIYGEVVTGFNHQSGGIKFRLRHHLAVLISYQLNISKLQNVSVLKIIKLYINFAKF